MKRLAFLILTLSSTATFAEGVQIGAHIGHLNVERHLEQQGSLEQTATGSANTNIQGIRATYNLGLVNLYSGLDLARFHLSPSFQTEFGRLSVGGQYELVDLVGIKLSVLGGLNGMRIRDKPIYADDTFDGEGSIQTDYEFEAFNVLNAELGLNVSYEVLPRLSLIAEYKLSETLAEGDHKIKLTKTNGTETTSQSIKSDDRFRTNELVFGALWSL